MPTRIFGTRDEFFTVPEVLNLFTSGIGALFGKQKISVPVLVASWTAQTAAAGNPVPTGETWYYADLVHNLGSKAHPVGAYDISAFNVPWQTHQARDANTVRVWLAFSPTSDIEFKVYA